MAESIKKKAIRLVQNDLTWPRVVMVRFLTSFFQHSPDFKWDADLSKTEIAILDSRSELSMMSEAADRVIIQRQAFSGQSIVTDNRINVNRESFVHGIVKPRLGYLNIFCESRNDVQSEYIAVQVENVLLMHKEELMEKNLLIGPPTLSDVREPYSGTNFFSMMLSVPTHIVGKAEFSIENPEMVGAIEIEFGIGSTLSFEVKTE